MEKSVFSLRYTDEGVYLSLEPQTKFVGPKLRQQMVSLLGKKKLTGLNMDMVNHILAEGMGEALIAPPQPELKVDEEFDIMITRNLLTANITFTPADGGALKNTADIYKGITGYGVTFGIKEMMLELLGDNPNKDYNIPIPIARGIPPINGDDAWVEYHVKLNNTPAPKINEDGSVDYKDINLINNVRKGTLLATLHPETPGTSGLGVNGQEIPARGGKKKALPKGVNTTISEDGLKLIAAVDGRLDVQSGKVCVIRYLEIDGDVGVPTGHVEFFGDIIVKGNVIAGYNVKASNTIVIEGCVESCIIEAGRHIVIKQGIKGKANCTVTAGGDITAKFIENAVVSAGGTIRADMIMHSKVSSLESVLVYGKYGNITSGTVAALKDIVCMNAGNTNMTPTALRVGIAPEEREQYEALAGKVNMLEKELNSLETLIKSLNAIKKESGLTPKRDKQLLALSGKKAFIKDKYTVQKAELDALKAKLNYSMAGKIRVGDTLYPNTDIAVASAEKRFDKPVRCSIFKYYNNEVVVIPDPNIVI